MKIDVIVPTNNIKEINCFIKSFSSLKEFKKLCRIVIVGNGSVVKKDIVFNNSLNIHFINTMISVKQNEEMVPFLELRALGMIDSNSDFFLLMDSDHTFPDGSDSFLMNCIEKLKDKQLDISVLCTDRIRDGKDGLYKKDGYIWSNRGLFIENLFDKYFLSDIIDIEILGASEDLLLSYYVLEQKGNPYIIHGSPVKRVEKRHVNGIVKYDKSYDEKNMYMNCLGYIRSRYNDSSWTHKSGKFPKLLNDLLNKRCN